VYVVADFEALRIGLSSVLDTESGLAKAGEAATIEAMVADAASQRADVVLMDVRLLAPAAADEFNRWLKSSPESLRVLVFGSNSEAVGLGGELLGGLFGCAGLGFMFDHTTVGRLVEGIRLVASGTFVCECDLPLARELWGRLRTTARAGRASEEHLSERELEVLLLVAEGLSNKQIAEHLYLSEGTVKVHVSRIIAKLGLERRTELVRYAIGKGLTLLDELSERKGYHRGPPQETGR
jgi:DNA-binding NarL/FixJ family response regulator